MKHRSIYKPQSNAQRIGKLEVLPVFLDLQTKPVVVIGSSVGATWKAELLANAGAWVTIISENPSAELLQLVSNADVNLRFQLCVRKWTAHDFRGAFAVVADVEGHEVEMLYDAVKPNTSLINIIDKPAFCTFQFGSIVNRSPLVIGISTGGAAPVLAQNVRGRIEAVLPQTVQALAEHAKRIRKRVNAKLGDAQHRRAYWQAFFERGFGQTTPQPSTAAYVIHAASVDDLTLRDIRHLQSADLIEYQTGVDARIFDFARREAKRCVLGSTAEDLYAIGVVRVLLA